MQAEIAAPAKQSMRNFCITASRFLSLSAKTIVSSDRLFPTGGKQMLLILTLLKADKDLYVIKFIPPSSLYKIETFRMRTRRKKHSWFGETETKNGGKKKTPKHLSDHKTGTVEEITDTKFCNISCQKNHFIQSLNLICCRST